MCWTCCAMRAMRYIRVPEGMFQVSSLYGYKRTVTSAQ